MWYVGLSCLGISLGLGFCWRKYFKRSLLPPSPPGHWFWGNRHLVSESWSHIKLGTELREKYGDIISLSSPFGTTIIVNSIDLATELLEKQAAITANRPRKAILDDIMQWNVAVSWHPPNERHKKIRRLMASALSPTASRKYIAQQAETALKISKVLMLSPPTFAQDIRQELGAFYMRMAYGHIAVKDDPLIRTNHQALGYLFRGLLGYFWVDDLPFLRFLPDWFPGTGFKTIGKEAKRLRDTYVNEPFDKLLDQMSRKQEHEASYASRLIEEKGGPDADPEVMDLIRWSTAGIFSGGTSPTVAFIATLLVMTTLYPETAKRAQLEIDSVTGRSRLPSLEDLEHAPYCKALLQEIMRMFPPAPLGVPHSASEDIYIRGYLIPKGAAIYGNIWGMLFDPEKYDSPFEFNPDRFLQSNSVPDPVKWVFGFGRRACPGMHIANNGIGITCATILALFDLQPTEELLARVANAGGRHSPGMHKVIASYAFGESPCRVEIRDSVAATLLENS